MSNLQQEVWKDIIGYEGLYEISSLGRVKSIRRKKILKPNVYSGYCRVILQNQKVISNRFIHRIVAENFIDNPECKPQVNHIDFNTQNNNISNLEWCTNLENAFHSKIHGRKKGSKNGHTKLNEDQVLKIKRSLKNSTPYHEICNQFKITYSHLLGIANGKIWGWLT